MAYRISNYNATASANVPVHIEGAGQIRLGF